nr:hypothetical protein BaRGS_020311 [Batillaria attramentaria]
MAHGTFIGHIRLESKKPQQVPIDSEIHFGASTRIYIIRERPQPIGPGGLDEDGTKQSEKEGNLLGLPESETELDITVSVTSDAASEEVVISGPAPLVVDVTSDTRFFKVSAVSDNDVSVTVSVDNM